MVARSRSQGFTLVELMIALVIGLLLIAAAGQLFLMTKRNYDRMTGLLGQQEALQFVTDVVSLDLRTAYTLVIDPEFDDDSEDISDCRGGNVDDVTSGAGRILHARFLDSRVDD